MQPELLSIGNGKLRCAVAPLGAELRSLQALPSQEEYLWQRDALYWPDSAPILFPVVGRLKDGRYRHQGQDYTLPIHGFARGLPFTVVEQQATSLALVLRDSDATRANYPFPFVLLVRFTLDSFCLNVSYQVTNTGSTSMPFSLGSHPGFRLPASPRGLSDWSLVFSEAEEGRVFRLGGDLLDTADEALTLVDGRRLTLSPSLFERDALIFKALRSRHIRLVHRAGRVRLSVALGDAPSLGLWSRPGADYICIEPWYGFDDDALGSTELAAKPGIIRLAPEASFRASYSVCVPPAQA